MRLRGGGDGGGDGEPATCVAVLASGARAGEVCGKTGKEFNGKFYCGYHLHAAKTAAAKKMAEIEKLMEKLGVSKEDVMKAWEGGESSGVPVGVPIKVPVAADAEVADETAAVDEHDLD